MLQVRDLTLTHTRDLRTLAEKFSFTLNEGDKAVLIGEEGNGKSTLAESMLFLTGVTDRLGSTAAGNSVSDYEAGEIRRQISISATTMHVEDQKTKTNIIATPGHFDFAGGGLSLINI